MKATNGPPEEIARVTSKRSAEVPERLQGGVLRGAFKAVEGWSADPQATGHFNLREASILPEPAKKLR
jgi:hypothetical protein